MTTVLTFLALWLIPGFLAYGFELAYWCGEFPGTYVPWGCVMSCVCPICGPVATLVFLLDQGFHHGFRLSPP